MDLYCKLLILLSAIFYLPSAAAQTGSINVDENHNGHKIFGLPTPTTGNEAATKAYADSVGGGGGGGSGTVTSLTATAPIVVTPSPLVTTGVISLSGTSYGFGFLPLADAAAARSYIGALGSSSIDNTAYTSSWAGFTTIAPSKKAVYDEIHSFTTAHDGFVNVLDQTTGITNTNGIGIIQAPKLIGTDIQAYDADLTSLAAASGTNTIYYRSAADTWSPVTIGGNMTFSGGTLNSTAGGSGTVTTTGSPATGNLTKFSGATAITNGDLSGNVTTSGTLATTIANSAVTYAKMQNVSANSVLLGSNASGSGSPPSEIALGTNLSMTGSTLNAAAGSPSAPLTLTVNDAVTNVVTDILTLAHDTTGTPAIGLGTGIMFRGESSTTLDQIMGEIAARWNIVADGTRNSYFNFTAANNAGLMSASQLRIYSSGFITNDGTTDAGNTYINSKLGYQVGGTGGNAGNLLRSDGTKFIASGFTVPNSPGGAGYTFRSDGTNLVAYPAQLVNASVSSQSPSTSDVYLAGSNVIVTAGDFQAKGQYKCVFDMTKSAGTGGIVISVRAGTLGTTGDTAQLTFTFPAGTSVADVGVFEIFVTWRTVGSGTSAVVQGVCKAFKNTVTAAGMWSDTSAAKTIVATTSSGFASNTFTNIGVSFNGGTAFAGTTTLVQAQLQQ